MTRKSLTEIVCILDRSGSMSPFVNDSIGGFNKFLEEQKQIPGEVKITLILFDNEYTPIYNSADIRHPLVKPLDHETYVPRGTTALYDAVGKSIDALGARLKRLEEEERPGKVLVVILTDGEENDSKEYTRSRVFEQIKHQRDKYNWEFIYLGANQDAMVEGNKIGIIHNINYLSTHDGYQKAYHTVSCVARSFRSTGQIKTDDDFVDTVPKVVC